eukprot:4548264-Pleurochrysis_carterae.AAC.1
MRTDRLYFLLFGHSCSTSDRHQVLVPQAGRSLRERSTTPASPTSASRRPTRTSRISWLACRCSTPMRVRREWAKPFEDFPKSVADVKVSEENKIQADAIPPCSMRLPANMGFRQHQDRLGYVESIRYNNMRSGHLSKATLLRLAQAAAAEIPILSQGS